jgi:hypothetical protein
VAAPRNGSKYTYTQDRGLADRATGDTPLSSEMASLDLPPSTVVTVSGYDSDRDLILFDWVDASGNPRTTSIDLDDFNESFSKGA